MGAYFINTEFVGIKREVVGILMMEIKQALKCKILFYHETGKA